MTTRTDALLSQQETGKITASINPCCARLSPGALKVQLAARSKVLQAKLVCANGCTLRTTMGEK